MWAAGFGQGVCLVFWFVVWLVLVLPIAENRIERTESMSSKQTDTPYESTNASRSESTSREAKQEDLISLIIVLEISSSSLFKRH